MKRSYNVFVFCFKGGGKKLSIRVPDYDFPILYNEDYLILMVRDQKCLYAYWELSCETQNAVSSHFVSDRGEYQLILRVYDLTGLELDSGCHSYFDVRLHPLADNYFINNVDSNRSYYVELGCYEPGGDFIGIMRSNLINTPRNSVAIGSELFLSGLAGEKKAKQNLFIGSYANLGIYGEVKAD